MDAKQALNIIALVGGIVALIALFLPWAVHHGLYMTTNYSGIDILSADPFEDASWEKFTPILSAIFGVITIVFAGIGLRSESEMKIGILIAIFGLLIVICALLFNGINDEGIHYFPILMDQGMGSWVALVGGALMLVGGAATMIPGITSQKRY